ELVALTRRDFAVGLGLGLVLPNLGLVSFDFRRLAAGERPVFQPVGDAFLLILLATVDPRSVVAVAFDFAARLILFSIVVVALTRRDDAVGLGLGLVLLNLGFLAFDFRRLAAGERPVFQPVGDAVLLVLLAAVDPRSIVAVAFDFAARLI